MPTQQGKRSREEEESSVDDQGRKHDSRGRFTSGSEEEEGNGARQSGTKNRGQSKGGPTGQGAKRVISRAVRVLDEIESRLSELREELERQTGGSSNGGEESDEEDGRQARGFAALSPEERREIARKGGRAAHEQGTAHEWDEEEAREASRTARSRS